MVGHEEYDETSECERKMNIDEQHGKVLCVDAADRALASVFPDIRNRAPTLLLTKMCLSDHRRPAGYMAAKPRPMTAVGTL